MIVEEIVHGTNLTHFVLQLGPILDAANASNCTLAIRQHLLLDISAALQYLHEHPAVLVHGDLKPGNILVEGSRLRTRITDFGLARCKAKQQYAVPGTRGWQAPEQIVIKESRKGPSDEVLLHVEPSIDIFSFGLVAYFIAIAKKPAFDDNNALLWERDMASLESTQRYSILCLMCTRWDPDSRPKARTVRKELLSWPFHMRTQSDNRQSLRQQLETLRSSKPWEETRTVHHQLDELLRRRIVGHLQEMAQQPMAWDCCCSQHQAMQLMQMELATWRFKPCNNSQAL